jgi:hypothetical protein
MKIRKMAVLLRKMAVPLARELLLAVVFLSAAWISVGLDPNENFLRGFFLYAYSLVPIAFLFWVIPFFIVSFSIMTSYFTGGFLRLLPLVLVFVGEIFKYSLAGVVIILIGIVITIFPPIRQ